MPDWSLIYRVKAFEILRDLENAGRHVESMTYHELATVFEYWSALQLSKTTGQQFFMYNDVSPSFKEATDLPLKDCGIDLCNMQDAIVQCKLRTGSLTWRDVATFYGSQNRFNAATGRRELVQWPQLVITRNAESKLAPALQPMMQGVQDVTVSDADFRTWCASLLAEKPCLPPQVVPSFYLRDYQHDAIACIRQGRDACRNVVISLPTGTGKNVVMLYSMDFDQEDTSYLVLVPRIVLMEQLHDVALAHFPHLRGLVQCIGGEESHRFQSGMRLIICVYNSVHHVTPHVASFTRIYVDEAHHIRSPELYTMEEDSHEGIELDDDEEEEEEKEEEGGEEDDEEEEDDFSVTETKISPIRAIWEMHLRQNNVYMSATIDADAMPNSLFFCRDIRDMIDAGVIADYEIRVPIFSQVPNDENVAQYLLDNDRSILIFCSSQESGEAFTVTLNRLQPGSAGYIDARTPRRQRIMLLQKFNDGLLPFLVNVEVLVEGFDAPATRGVCFLHMPQSHVKIVQVVGRALRLHPLKSIARIYLPCTTEDDGTSAEHVLRTLARNDSRIRASFLAKKQRSYVNIHRAHVNEGTDVNAALENTAQHLHDMVYNSLGHLTNSDEVWAARWTEVQQYFDIHGKWPPRGPLGIWVTRQRLMKSDNKLVTERISALERHPRWVWNKEERWEQRWEEVKAFFSAHAVWPSQKTTLGTWVSRQRKNYNSQTLQMTAARILALTSHPNWTWDACNLDEKWMTMWVKVQEFWQHHQRWPSYSVHDPDEMRLGNWVQNQRSNKTRGEITSERIAILDAHPAWVWRVGEDSWQTKWQQAQEFFAANKRWPAGSSHEKTEKGLAKWVGDQRMSRKKNTILPERVSLLESHHAWSWGIEEMWDASWKDVQDFFTKHNAWPSSSRGDAHERKLGRWIGTQRKAKKKDSICLTPERIDTLESHPSWIWGFDDIWQQTWVRVQAFYTEHQRWPSSTSKSLDEMRLGEWILNQRQDKRTFQMTKQRITKLEAHPAWSWGTQVLVASPDWHTMWKTARDFFEANQRWPNSNSKDLEEKRAGGWITEQRKKKKHGIASMTPEKITLLESHSAWVWDLDQVWQQKCEEVHKFYDAHNRWPSCSSRDETEKALGRWISNQRSEKKTNDASMTPERISALESHPKWFWHVDSKWDDTWQEVQAFFGTMGRWPLHSAKGEDEARLAKWISHQRTDRKNGRPCMTTERIETLEAHPSWTWDARKRTFDELDA